MASPLVMVLANQNRTSDGAGDPAALATGEVVHRYSAVIGEKVAHQHSPVPDEVTHRQTGKVMVAHRYPMASGEAAGNQHPIS